MPVRKNNMPPTAEEIMSARDVLIKMLDGGFFGAMETELAQEMIKALNLAEGENNEN